MKQIDSNNVIPLFQKSPLAATVVGPHIPGPIKAQMQATLMRLTNSQYPDDFDWGVYDKIASKFDEQQRGSVVFNTTFKLVNHHSSCSKCHYAFEIDAYGRGCFHRLCCVCKL